MVSRTHGPTDAELVRWDDRRDGERLRRNIEALLGVLVVEQGQVVSHEIFRADAIMYVLDSLIDLHGVASEETRYRLLRAACFRLPLLKSQSVAAFRRVLASGVRRHMQSPRVTFRIVLPLNIDPRSVKGRNHLRAKGLQFYVRAWPDLERHLAIDDWLREAGVVVEFDELALRRSFVPLEVSVVGRDHREAFDEAYAAFELMQCLLNLEAFHRYTVQMGRPKPLGRVWLPPVYGAFRPDGAFESYYYESESMTRTDARQVSKEVLTRAVALMREFDRESACGASTIRLVEEAFRRYGRALNTTNWREAFLSLWQVLELLTHDPDGRYTIEEVCRRAKLLLRRSPLLCDLLETCYRTRNGLVHVGKFPDEGLKDVNMLKAVVEHCINAVYNLRRQCPDRASLLVYYQNAGANDHELAVRARIVASVRRERAASSKSAKRSA